MTPDNSPLRMLPFEEAGQFGIKDALVPLPYSLRPVRYDENEEAWATDRPARTPDAFGRVQVVEMRRDERGGMSNQGILRSTNPDSAMF